MKARVKIEYVEYLTIDLSDYGHDENVNYEDLSEEEKDEISDHLREEVIVSVRIETINDDY